jgi:hypothetical protein
MCSCYKISIVKCIFLLFLKNCRLSFVCMDRYFAPCKICIAYTDVGKGREQERKLSPHPCGLCRRYDSMDGAVEHQK